MKAILEQYEARVAQKFPEVMSDTMESDVKKEMPEIDPLSNERIVADEIAGALKSNVNAHANDRY